MKFAFDIDGTITAAPEAFAALIDALVAAGHEVHVLTGTMDARVTSFHYQRRRLQLEALGIDPATVTLKVVTNPPITAKADYCRKHGIDFVFEDSVEWSTPIAAVCPVTLMVSREVRQPTRCTCDTFFGGKYPVHDPECPRHGEAAVARTEETT